MINIKASIVFILILSSSYYRADATNLMNLSLEELLKVRVVTAASGFEQNIRQAPATVTVITSEEWQSKGARKLSDVLETVPGFHVGKPPALYKHKKFIIRGLSGVSSSQIKLLIDGEPFEYMQDNGLFSGFELPLSSFQRIEIIKGPGSAVYGADAFAGIVNLVTFKQNEMPAQIGGRLGAFNSYDFFASGAVDLEDSHLQWAIDYMKSDDDKNRIVSSDLQSIFDGIFDTNATNAPGPIDDHYKVLLLSTKWQWQNLQFDYLTWRNFDVGLGAGIAQALDTRGHGSVQVNNYNIQYDLSEYIKGNLKATFSYKDQRSLSYLYIFPAGTVVPIGADGNADFVSPTTFSFFSDGYIGTPSNKGNTTSFQLSHLFSSSKTNIVRWQLGYETQDFKVFERKNFGPGILNGTEIFVDGNLTDVTGTPYIYLPNKERDFYYLSIQDEWQVSQNLQLNFGVRYDDYSDFGSTTNPRISIIWQPQDEFTIKLFAGSAFKAPSYTQLYAQNNPVALGNPELGPENVDTFEAGLNFEYLIDNNLLLSFSFYDYQAADLVDFVFDPQQQGNVAQNIGEQKGQGGEFVLKWKPPGNITLDFSYSFLSAKDHNGADIIDIPQNMAYFSVNWSINDNWTWNVDAKWIADRKRAQSDPRPELDNYTWVNSRIVRKDLIKNMDISLSVKNLFDQDAKEPSNGTIADDYPLAGRQWMIELIYKF